MPPVEIDDVRLKRVLTRKLVGLVESGEASPPKELLSRVPRTWSGVDVASAPPQEMAPEEIESPRQMVHLAHDGAIVADQRHYGATRPNPKIAS